MRSATSKEQPQENLLSISARLAVSVVAGLLIYASLFNVILPSRSFLLPLICGIFVGFFFDALKPIFVSTFIAGVLSELLIGPPELYRSLWLTEASLLLVQVTSFVAGGILIWAGLKSFRNRVIFSYFLLGIIVLAFLGGVIAQDLKVNPRTGVSLFQLASMEPPAERYGFDGFLFLKTFYLMKGGYGYYQAFGKAYNEDYRLSGVPPTVQGWRLPTVFYLWRFVLPPNGSWVIYLFILFSIAAIVSSFFIASYFTKAELALVSASLVSAYLFFAAVTMWFPFAEYWGLFFAIISLAFYVYRRSVLAVLFAVGAVLIRELYLIFVLILFLVSLMSKKLRDIFSWLAALLAFGIVYIVHYLSIKSLYGISGTDFSSWLGGGLWFLGRTSGFGMKAVAQGEVVRYVVLILASIAVIVMPQIKNKVLFGGVLWLPMALFLFTGSSVWREYWGVVYMPFALILAPIGFSVLPHFKAGRETRCHQPSAMSVTEGS